MKARLYLIAAFCAALGLGFNGSTHAFAQDASFDDALRAYKDALKSKQSEMLSSAEDKLCAVAQKVAIPDGDKAPASEAAGLKDCASDKLYYDYEAKGPDYIKARMCAYDERERAQANKDAPDGSPLQGPGVLTMLYANGQGVSRNWPLAFRFTCEAGGAPAELSGRLEHLSKMMDEKDPSPISFCDDITSGYMAGFCASIDSEKNTFKREAELKELLKDVPDPARSKYAVLSAAAKSFIEAQASAEQDMSGTMRGAIALDQENKDWEEFMTLMRSLKSNDQTLTSATDPKQEDRKLNEIYRKLMALPGLKPEADNSDTSADYGTVTSKTIRETQRLWIAYRDAWVDFAKALRPSSENAILSLVTAKRAAQLNEILNPDGN
ncbi:lysozyme inhibitor LprI family protein [Oryzifoliimicrobium ureilyticus]|uniref:lysozyme inhibitor LprI family protein n=1 Tax=Oryzifoliimicrobium ureilyticus TaxID=3113724 RepID=UPI0030766CF8